MSTLSSLLTVDNILKAEPEEIYEDAVSFDLGDTGQHDAFDAPYPGSSLSATGPVPENETDRSQVYTFSPSFQRPRPLSETDITHYDTFAPVPPILYDPGIQNVRSIETLDQFNVQLCGTSAELDPWLLRHSKFDDVGMRPHGRIRIRTVGGVPIGDMIPVHFTVVDDSLHEQTEARPSSLQHRREELNALVAPEAGLRLISL